MSIDPASFKVRFPEFTSESDSRIQLFIDDSVVLLNSVYWGEKYDLGLHYLSAHYLTLAQKSEAGSSSLSGPVASRSVGDVSIAYANTTPEDQSEAFYSATSYGQRYLALRKTIGVPACVI